MTAQNLKPVTQDEVLNRVRGLSGRIVKTALLAAVVYTTFLPLGLILGGWAGAAVAAHFALGWWSAAGATALGVGAGAVSAFFGAKALVADKVADIVIGTGLTAGEMGLRSLLRLLKQSREQKPGEAGAQAARLEKAVEKSHSLVTRLRNFFGETREKTAGNSNVTPPPPAQQNPKP